LHQEWATAAFVDKNIKIIDIRTAPEWRETGIVKGSYTLTFFDEQGNYNTELFLKELSKIVDKDEPFALICRTGSRTGMLADFLANKLGYNVTNLKGGIVKMIREGYKPVRYLK